MKKTLLLVSLFASIAFISCKSKTAKGPNGVTYNTPAQYNDYIVNKQGEIMKDIMVFGETLASDPKGLLEKLPVYASEAETVVNDIKGMPAYSGNTEMRDEAVKLFSFYVDIFKNEYREMAQLSVTLDGQPANAEQTQQFNAFVAQVTKKEEPLDKSFQKAQRDFAKKHNMRMFENDMQKQIDNLN